jgi:DNA-binding MarR family transcriptional regulator
MDTTRFLRDLAKQARLEDDPAVKLAIEACEHDQRMIPDMELLFSAEAWEKGNRISPDPFLPPEEEEINGPIKIGYTRDGIEFGVHDSEGNQHMFVSGRSGAGKTHTVRDVILPQLAEDGKKLLITDFKRDYFTLIKSVPGILVVEAEDFKHNPLEVPKNCNPNRHAQLICGVYRRNFGMMHASEGEIYQDIYDLYSLFGVFEQRGVYPTFSDLLEYEKSKSLPRYSEEAKYRDRTINRLETINRAIGETINVSKGFDLEDILTNNVIILLDGLGYDIANFLVESLFMSIFEYKLTNQKDVDVKNFIILDECKRLFSIHKEREYAQGHPVMTHFVNQIRSCGVGLLVCEHQPSMINPALLASSYIKIMMSLGDGRDIFTMARAMGLNPEQEKEAYHLDVGEAIVKLSGRYTRPFKIKVPEGTFPSPVSEEELRNHYQRSFEFLNRKVMLRSDLLQKFQSREKDRASAVYDVLENLTKDPFAGFVDRCKALNMDRSKLKRTIDNLILRGLITPVTVRTFKKGGQKILYQLTEKGQELLRGNGVDTSHKIRGDLAHLYYVNLVGEYFSSQGFKVRLEGESGNGNADLVVSNNRKAVAVEIELGEKTAVNNILKNLKDFDGVIMAFEKESTRKKIEGMVDKWEKSLKDKVRLNLIEDFVKDGNDSFLGEKEETKGKGMGETVGFIKIC